MSPEVISVKNFIDILNETLSFAYPSVIVEGEVGSFKTSQGKWVFFDLKEEDATLPCFLPVYQLKVELEDGMKVRVTGTPKLTKWGKFSLTVKSVELAGEGELRRAFVLLKGKLEAEGLFSPERKRPLPRYPKSIGLVASGQSAAYHDFVKILASRWGGLDIKLADVQVQGTPAPDQITAAIEHFNQLASPVDVLVIIRGGGSLEDLQAFNTEQVARAVAGSRTPTIVGVGHEVDVTLADFASDLRAATPTDAARLVVPDRIHVGAQVEHLQSMLSGSLERRLSQYDERLARAMATMERALQRPLERLQQLERLLASFNPAATLARGYAILWQADQVVRSVGAVSTGEAVIQLADGNIDVTLEKQRDKE
jgi:exodeoxyribonuclease VII large subunit